ncbi:MAG: AAA domain-containing protein [Bacteroidales bacterium]
MIEIAAAEYYSELQGLLETNALTLPESYRRVRFLFERLCKQVTVQETMQFPNLFSRLSWILQHKLQEEWMLCAELNALRVRINKITKEEVPPTLNSLREDILILASGVRALLGEPFSAAIEELSRSQKRVTVSKSYPSELKKRIRARFMGKEGGYLLVLPEDKEDQEPVRVRVAADRDGRNPFAETLELLHEGAQVNFLNVYHHEKEDCFVAEFIVLEPDFLLDISAIAECFRDYGHHPLNYFMSRLSPDRNTHYMLLGNIANQFLDDIVNETAEHPADYLVSMSKAFRQSPISIAACGALDDETVQKNFFDETKRQFHNIREVVREQFPQNQLDAGKALLEPSFVSESLGIQGRLDLLQEDFTKFIELKSGKAKENFYTKEISHKENHYVQMMLYYAVLQFNLGIAPEQIDSYLLYSKYPLLYRMAPYWGLVKQAIDLRNQIVGLEYRLQQHNDPEYSREILHTINAETLNTAGLKDKYWNAYLKPEIDNFAYEHAALAPIESDYYHSLFTFITREQYTSKAGDTEAEFNKGVSMLWNASLEEKEEAGEIIRDLKIEKSEVLGDKHLLHFLLPENGDANLPNYRTGDSILLYQRDGDADRVTNRQVFKASIEEIDSRKMVLTLRAIQKNQSVLPVEALYAIERDYMDVAFSAMFKGLAQFMYATDERRSLLLAQRQPRGSGELLKAKNEPENDVERVVRKAVAARDYFLLVGPPGTGKTSYALRRMVETFYAEPQTNILLLAYTNKAVDEICRSLATIEGDVPFVRIGQESACEEEFKDRLLKNVMKDCMRRVEVRRRLEGYRIFVGTVSSFSRQTELFRLKSFDVAIVDEATQILEPQILGLLSATDAQGRDAIRKFILIGDYKQLPAVVVQSDECAAVKPESLRAIGMNSHKESLFERLYRWEQTQGRDAFCDMLTLQGRMHPAISYFPSKYFYHGKLGVIPLKHQQEDWGEDSVSLTDLPGMVARKRFAFFPVVKRNRLTSNKLNPEEAAVVALLIEIWYKRKIAGNESFDPVKNIGVITPYRSQIAMIRRELQRRNVPDAEKIVIDTVERFQGGQKDLMIYSCCMNEPYQLNFLSNTIEEEGALIDRKLNVALTRARKQMFVVGNPTVLFRDPIYRRMLEHIREHKGYFIGRYE